MLIGTMNHPGCDLFSEIEWMTAMGFDFIDLTLEPPRCEARNLNLPEVRRVLESNRLRVVGHTAYYLPLCNPFEMLRRAAVEEIKQALEAFGFLGAHWMTLHPDRNAPLHDRHYVIERNLQTFRDLQPTCRTTGVGLMLENLPCSFNTPAQLGELLDPMPELGFHLDVGHANLSVEQNTTPELLAAFGTRLKHVHLHDNKGGHADLHLPLGAGTLDTQSCIRALKESGYDGTITLEVFTPDRHHLEYSRKVLRDLWDRETSHRLPPKRREATCC